jgi:hypothetical protein
VLSVLPKGRQFVQRARYGLEMAAPAVVWLGTAYPRDQTYPIRPEFLRTIALPGSLQAASSQIGVVRGICGRVRGVWRFWKFRARCGE